MQNLLLERCQLSYFDQLEASSLKNQDYVNRKKLLIPPKNHLLHSALKIKYFMKCTIIKLHGGVTQFSRLRPTRLLTD